MPKLRTELDGDGLARVAWSYTQVPAGTGR